MALFLLLLLQFRFLFGGLVHCSVYGGDSVVIDSLFNVHPIVCRVSLYGICVLMHYLVAFLIVQ